MYKLLQVALNDLRITFQDKSIWVNLVLIPVFLVFIIGVVTGPGTADEGDTILMDVLNNDNASEISEQFLASLRQANPALKLCPFDNDDENVCDLNQDTTLTIETAEKRIDDGATSALLIIPVDFAEAVLAGEPTQVIFRSDSDLTSPNPLAQTVQAAIQRVAGSAVAAQVSLSAYTGELDDQSRDAFRQAVYATASSQWQEPPATIAYSTTATDDGDSVSGFSQSAPGIGTMYVMFTTLAGAVIIIQERKQWTLQRLLVMPVTRWQLLGGKVLARFLMGMIQYMVAFGVGALLGAEYGSDPLALLLIMIGFALASTALAFLMASFVKTEQQASSLTTFIVLVAAPIGGAWWPLEIVPDFMQSLAYASPIGWAMQGFNELSFYGGTLNDVILPIVVLFGLAAVLFSIAVTRFSYEA